MSDAGLHASSFCKVIVVDYNRLYRTYNLPVLNNTL